MAGVSGEQTRRIGSMVWALVGAGPRVIRSWREGQALGPPKELCRRGLGRDSESWGRWEALGKDREKARFGRKSVSGGWKWEAGAERLGKRLPTVIAEQAVAVFSGEMLVGALGSRFGKFHCPHSTPNSPLGRPQCTLACERLRKKGRWG